MIYAKRRPRRRHHFPAFGNFLHDVVNAPVKEVVNDEVKFTYPAVNVMEYDTHFSLQLAVPGFSKKDISISVEKDQLIISSEREGSDEGKYTMREFNYGKFTRKFILPEEVNVEGIDAKFANGVLNLHIPKAEEVKPRTINIK